MSNLPNYSDPSYLGSIKDRKRWAKSQKEGLAKRGWYADINDDGIFNDSRLERIYRNYLFEQNFSTLDNYDDIYSTLNPQQRDNFLTKYRNATHYNSLTQTSGLGVNPYDFNEDNTYQYIMQPTRSNLSQNVSNEDEDTQEKLEEAVNNYLKPVYTEEEAKKHNEQIVEEAKEIAKPKKPSFWERVGESLASAELGFNPNDISRVVEAEMASSDYVRANLKVPLSKNEHYDLTYDQFKEHLPKLSSTYNNLAGTHYLPADEIESLLPELYKRTKPLLDAGNIAQAEYLIDNSFNDIAGENQSSWEKLGIFSRNLAGGIVEGTLDMIANPASFLWATGDFLADKALGSWYNSEAPFAERMMQLGSYVHSLEEAISGNNQVYGNDFFDRAFFQNGYTFGIMIPIVASEALIGLGAANKVTKLSEGVDVAKKAGDINKAAQLTQQINKVEKTASRLSRGNMALQAYDEGFVDGIETRKSIILDGEAYKNSIRQDLYERVINDPNKTNYSYNEEDVKNIYNTYLNADSTKELINNAITQYRQTGAVATGKDEYGNILYTHFNDENAVVSWIQGELLNKAVDLARAEYLFKDKEAELDKYTREQANTAAVTTILEEALIVGGPTLFGMGKLGQLIPNASVANLLKVGANKLSNAVGNKWLGFGIGTAAGVTTLTGGEIAEEIGQGFSSNINELRADYNIKNYIDGLYYGAGTDEVLMRHMGILEGIGQFSEDAWYKMNPEQLVENTFYSTLMFSGVSMPSKRKDAVQRRQENKTKLGEAFDLIAQYSPIKTGLGQILVENKANYLDASNEALYALRQFTEDPENVSLMQSEAAWIDIKKRMDDALKGNKISMYGTAATAYKAAEASLLAHLATTANGTNRKYAEKLLRPIQEQAELDKADDETRAKVLSETREGADNSVVANMSDEDLLATIVSQAKEKLDLYNKALSIAEEFKNNTYLGSDVRPLIFGKLLDELADSYIKDLWQAGTSVYTQEEKNKIKETLHKKLIERTEQHKELTEDEIKQNEQINAYNGHVDYLLDTYFSPNSDQSKIRYSYRANFSQDKNMVEAFKDVTQALEQEHPGIINTVTEDLRLMNWVDQIHEQYQDVYQRLAKGEDLMTEEQYKEAHNYVMNLKNASSRRYVRSVRNQLIRRKDSIRDLVTYLKGIEADEEGVSDENHRNDREELYDALTKDGQFDNLKKAREIVQTSDNLESFIKAAEATAFAEIDAKNAAEGKNTSVFSPEKGRTAQMYSAILTALKEVTLNAKSFEELVELSPYAQYLNTSNKELQGLLTRLLKEFKNQADIPSIREINQEEITPQPKSPIQPESQHKEDKKEPKTSNTDKQYKDALRRLNAKVKDIDDVAQRFDELEPPEDSIESVNEYLKKAKNLLQELEKSRVDRMKPYTQKLLGDNYSEAAKKYNELHSTIEIFISSFEELLDTLQNETAPKTEPDLKDSRHYVYVRLEGGIVVPYYTKNANYKFGEIVWLNTPQGIKSGVIQSYADANDPKIIKEFEAKATDIEKILTTKPEPKISSTERKVNTINPALRESGQEVKESQYKEVVDRIDFVYVNSGNIKVGDKIAFVVMNWNSPEGPRRVIYYTTQKDEKGNYHIINVIDTSNLDPTSEVGKLVQEIRDHDDNSEAFYYEADGWTVSYISGNTPNLNSRQNYNTYEEGNLNKVLDEKSDGTFGINFGGTLHSIILMKATKNGVITTDPSYTVDTLMESGNEGSTRTNQERIVDDKEHTGLKENAPKLVTPTTDGDVAYVGVSALDNKVEGYLDIIKQRLLSGEVGHLLRNQLRNRIADLMFVFRRELPAKDARHFRLNTFFKTNQANVFINNEHNGIFSIDIVTGNSKQTLCYVTYPDIAADANGKIITKGESAEKRVEEAAYTVYIGENSQSMTFEELYKFLVNSLINDKNSIINSVNINFEEIQNNPNILQALIKDGLLYTPNATLNANGKLNLTGANVTAQKGTVTSNKTNSTATIPQRNNTENDNLTEDKQTKVSGNIPAPVTPKPKSMAAAQVPSVEKNVNENPVVNIAEATLTNGYGEVKVYYYPIRQNDNVSLGSTTKTRFGNTATVSRIMTVQEYETTVLPNNSAAWSVEKLSKDSHPKFTNPVNTIEARQAAYIAALTKTYEEITDDLVLDRLDELEVTEELWNSLNPLEKQNLLNCGKA